MCRFACLFFVVLIACGSKTGATAVDAGTSTVDAGQLADAAADAGVDAIADSGADATPADAGTDAAADTGLDASAPDAVADTAADAQGQDALADSEMDAADGGAVVMCTGATPSFPTFDKSCTTSTECAIASHQINCCGTKVATGIAAGEKAAFDKAELTCEGQYPGCGCAQFPTTAEDGKSEIDGTIVVKCVAGTCKTSVTATIACTGDTIAFPKFAKECSGDEQCAIAKHQINCCGTKAAIGIQAAASEDFLAAEQVCAAQYPKCKCAVGLTQAEDGKTGQDGAIQVHCAGGLCGTFVP